MVMAISTRSLMSLLALCALAVGAEQDEVKHSVVGSGISQETSSKNAGTIQAMAPPHSEDDSDYKDNVKLVLEDFELSILESENLQFNSSTVLSALVTTNSTVRNLTEVAASSHRPKLSCLPSYHVAEGEVSLVSLLNGTELQARLGEESNPSLANRTFPANCSLTLFYASWCEFSAAAAPHYNALARLFPRLRMFAVDSASNHIINAQYGVISVPTLLVFHNGRPMYRFNHSEYSLDKYREFVVHLTGIEPENITVQLTDEDYIGPVPTVAVKGFNYNLLLASLFILACGLVDLSRTSVCRGLVDTLRNAWREAEIQHEHED